MKKIILLCAGMAAILMSMTPAHAASLIGRTLGVQYLYPTVNIMEGDFTYTVGSSEDIIFSDTLSGAFTESRFVLHALAATNFTGAAFNGIRIFDQDGGIDPFTSVLLSGLSTIPYLENFDMGRVSFDADNIFINLEGMGIRGGRDLIFDIETIATAVVANDVPGAVPEPAAWMMMLAGFGLIGGAMRRRGEGGMTLAF